MQRDLGSLQPALKFRRPRFGKFQNFGTHLLGRPTFNGIPLAAGKTSSVPRCMTRFCEEISESIFDLFAQETSSGTRRQAAQALAFAPTKAARILKLIFFEGKTVREISAIEGLPKSTVHDLKSTALRRLKRGHQGDGSDTGRLMKGQNKCPEIFEPSIWSEISTTQIRQHQIYDPENHEAELKAISWAELRVALFSLSERSRRILYLRHWCLLSTRQTAQVIRCGTNTVEQIEAAAIQKVKLAMIPNKTRNQFSGGEK